MNRRRRQGGPAGHVRLLRLQRAGRTPDVRTRDFVIRPVSDAAYFFVGSAAQNTTVGAPWVGWPLVTHAVYVRMRDGELFRTRYQRLADLQRRLDPHTFLAINRPFVVNVARMVAWEEGNVVRIGLQVGNRPGDVDLLPVSRSRMRRMRALIG